MPDPELGLRSPNHRGDHPLCEVVIGIKALEYFCIAILAIAAVWLIWVTFSEVLH